MEAGAREFIPRVTRRCLTEDLGLPAESVDLTIDELASANEVIAAFRERRAEMGSPGQEPIRSLLPEIVAFSLHIGRRLSIAFDLAGRELQPDEVAFCDFLG